jgi:hypothetical protein
MLPIDEQTGHRSIRRRWTQRLCSPYRSRRGDRPISRFRRQHCFCFLRRALEWFYPSSDQAVVQNLSKVYRRQVLNFGWAMLYNVALIPVAAGVLYPYRRTQLSPVWSALAMALSSISVVVSSLALKWGI